MTRVHCWRIISAYQIRIETAMMRSCSVVGECYVLTVTASCCRPLNGFLLVNSSWCRFNTFTAHSDDNSAFCHLWVVVSSTNHLSLWSVVFRFGLQVLHSTITLSYTSVMSWYYLHLRFLCKVSAGTLMNPTSLDYFYDSPVNVLWRPSTHLYNVSQAN